VHDLLRQFHRGLPFVVGGGVAALLVAAALGVWRLDRGTPTASGLVASARDGALLFWFIALAGVTLTPGSWPDAYDLKLAPLSDIRSAIRSLQWTTTPLLAAFFNVALFMPLGFLAPLVWRRLDHWWAVLLSSALLSAAIETAQLLLRNHRTVSTDDVLANTLGGLLGYGLMLAIRTPIRRSRLNRRRGRSPVPARGTRAGVPSARV
jgi:hypothetical protein